MIMMMIMILMTNMIKLFMMTMTLAYRLKNDDCICDGHHYLSVYLHGWWRVGLLDRQNFGDTSCL